MGFPGNSFQQGPFSFGPSPFSLDMLANALGSNTGAMENRYTQLGMAGSTPEQQDVQFQGLAENAAIGQEQTANVTNPAINTALQTPLQTGNPTLTSSLGTLISGLGSLGGSLGSTGNLGSG